MSKSFIVGVENARLQFQVPWDGENAPDLIKFPNGELFMKVGRYATKGDKYHYKLVEPVKVDTRIKDWKQYSELTG